MIRTMLSAAALLTLAFGSFGCAGKQHVDLDENDRGVRRADRVSTSNEFKKCIDTLLMKVSKKYANGFPSHVAVASDGAAVVRVSAITNRTSDRDLDLTRLRNDIVEALVDQDILVPLIDRGQRDETAIERDQQEFDAGNSQHDPDQATFVVLGEVTQERMADDDADPDIVQYTYEITLKFYDTVKDRLVVVSKARTRKAELQ